MASWVQKSWGLRKGSQSFRECFSSFFTNEVFLFLSKCSFNVTQYVFDPD